MWVSCQRVRVGYGKRVCFAVRLLLHLAVIVGGAGHGAATQPSLLLFEQSQGLLGGAEQLYALEMRRGVVDPGLAELLYGQRPIAPVQMGAGQPYAVVSTGYPRQGNVHAGQRNWTYTSALTFSPLQQSSEPPYLGAADYRTQIVGLLPGEAMDSKPDWLLLATPGAAEEAGALVLRSAEEDTADIVHTLPGVPLDATLFPDTAPQPGRVAVLYLDTASRRIYLRIQDPRSGVVMQEYALSEVLGLPEPGDRVAMRYDPSAALLWVAVSGFDLTQSGETAVSWVGAYDCTAAHWLPPVEVTGVLNQATPALIPVAHGQCWIATRSPGTQFGYVTLLAADGAAQQRLSKTAEYPLPNVEDEILLAPDPDTGDLAVAWGRRFEWWPGGRRGAANSGQRELEQPLVQLLHQEDAFFLLSAEALYRYAGAEEPLEVLYSAQFGALLQATPLPFGGDAPSEAAMPSHDTLRLQVRKTQYFRGEAVGRELHALHIHPVGTQAEEATWRIDYDQESMPWLRMHPRSGRGSGYVYMGVDPGQYTPDTAHRGVLTVRLRLEEENGSVGEEQLTQVVLRVAPPGSPIQRILWVWPEAVSTSFRAKDNPLRLNALGDMLAATPHFYSHREIAGPFQENLAPYAVVVVGLRALQEGGITRQALLNHVQSGGGLLILGETLEGERDPMLQRWLGALGVQLYTDVAVASRRGPLQEDGAGIIRPWSADMEVRGCLIQADDAVSTIRGDTESERTLLATGSYGFGRIAVLAGATPLESSALSHRENRRFAASLFRWLSRAGADALQE